MQVLCGLAVYGPNGGQGTNPARAYNARAGANGTPVPVSRLTRRYFSSAATARRCLVRVAAASRAVLCPLAYGPRTSRSTEGAGTVFSRSFSLTR
jgi:hypothetical protein